jgi:hypothetical protein
MRNSNDPPKGKEEPKRTPGQAEDGQTGGRPKQEPGRTPGQAEGTEEDVEENLERQKRQPKN